MIKGGEMNGYPTKDLECIVTYNNCKEYLAEPCFWNGEFDGWMVAVPFMPEDSGKIVSWKYKENGK